MTLIVKNLSVSYFRDRAELEIFRDVSIVIDKGTIFSIFGPNGCGKTTLLKAIGGIVPRKSGSVLLGDQDLLPEYVSIIPQDYRDSFFSWCSLYQNIILTQPKPFRNYRKCKHKIDSLKEEFGIEVDFNLRPHECSGGMLQQAAIVRAWLNSPRLILADEPFSALDVSISAQIRSNFQKKVINEQSIVVSVMHNMEEIVEIADTVFAIPNMPFSSDPERGIHLAELIANSSIKSSDVKGEMSFVEIARSLIGKRTGGEAKYARA